MVSLGDPHMTLGWRRTSSVQAQSRGPGSLPVHRGVGRWRQLTIRVQSAASIKGKFSPSGAENIFLGAATASKIPAPFFEPA